MTDPPVTTSEIANLLHRIRELSDNPASNPAERDKILARKADLLARLANQRTDDWARQLAHEAHTLATQAHGAAAPPQHDPVNE